MAPIDPIVTVALTMTPEAAVRFLAALTYAANRIPRDARVHYTDEMSHEDWLRWGASRLDAARLDAQPASVQNEESETPDEH